MAETYIPNVGDWFSNLETGDLFEVVAIDEASGSIGIQYLGGELEELDAESWEEMLLEPSAAPEDWAAPFDEIDRDDLGYEEGLHPENWSGPFADIDRED